MIINMSFRNDALVSIIRDRLMRDSRIAALSIDISCSEGYVSIVGVVDSPEQRDLIINLVSGMIGVRNVMDQLTVKRTTIYT